MGGRDNDYVGTCSCFGGIFVHAISEAECQGFSPMLWIAVTNGQVVGQLIPTHHMGQ